MKQDNLAATCCVNDDICTKRRVDWHVQNLNTENYTCFRLCSFSIICAGNHKYDTLSTSEASVPYSDNSISSHSNPVLKQNRSNHVSYRGVLMTCSAISLMIT